MKVFIITGEKLPPVSYKFEKIKEILNWFQKTVYFLFRKLGILENIVFEVPQEIKSSSIVEQIREQMVSFRGSCIEPYCILAGPKHYSILMDELKDYTKLYSYNTQEEGVFVTFRHTKEKYIDQFQLMNTRYNLKPLVDDIMREFKGAKITQEEDYANRRYVFRADFFESIPLFRINWFDGVLVIPEGIRK